MRHDKRLSPATRKERRAVVRFLRIISNYGLPSSLIDDNEEAKAARIVKGFVSQLANAIRNGEHA